MLINRVSTAVAAKVIGKCEDYIRWGLQQNRLPIGSAVQTGKNTWSYHVSPLLLSQYSGVPREVIESMCEDASRRGKKGGKK